jgi:hypothetical protein
MGMIERGINSAISKSRAESRPVVIGPWLKELQDRLPGFGEDELLISAVTAAMMQLDLHKVESIPAAPEQKTVSTSFFSVNDHSTVWVERAGRAGIWLACGTTVSPVFISKDWVISLETAEGEPVTDVKQYRTLDGKMMNYDFLESSRKVLESVVALGPGEITLEEGVPTPKDLVGVSTIPSEYYQLGDDVPVVFGSIGGDFFAPTSDMFHDGARIEVAAHELSAVADMIAEQGCGSRTTGEPEVLAEAFLSANGQSPCSLLRLVQGPDSCALVFNIPNEPECMDTRAFQATIRLLDNLSEALDTCAPHTSEMIRQYLEKATISPDAADQVGLLQPAWNKRVASEVVFCRPGLSLPMALVVRTSGRIAGPDLMLEAQRWTLEYVRRKTSGLTKKGRAQNMTYSRRGPSFFRQGDSPLWELYYADSLVTTNLRPGEIDASFSWFWKTAVRQRQLGDGSAETVLLVTGLSRFKDILPYYQELLRLFEAFACLARKEYPGAQFQTLKLHYSPTALPSNGSSTVVGRDAMVPTVAKVAVNAAVPSTGAGVVQQTASAPAAFCRWCGTRIVENARFCGHCGRAVE